MYTISQETKRNIERATGVSYDKLLTLTPEEEKALIEKKLGKKLKFSAKKRPGVYGRGNPLLAKGKIRTAEDLNKKSEKLFGI